MVRGRFGDRDRHQRGFGRFSGCSDRGGRFRYELGRVAYGFKRLRRAKGIGFCRRLFCQGGAFLRVAGPEDVIGIVLGVLGGLEFLRAALVLPSQARRFHGPIRFLHLLPDVVARNVAVAVIDLVVCTSG